MLWGWRSYHIGLLLANLGVRRLDKWHNTFWPCLPYLWLSIHQEINIGVWFILPIYPLLGAHWKNDRSALFLALRFRVYRAHSLVEFVFDESIADRPFLIIGMGLNPDLPQSRESVYAWSQSSSNKCSALVAGWVSVWSWLDFWSGLFALWSRGSCRWKKNLSGVDDDPRDWVLLSHRTFPCPLCAAKKNVLGLLVLRIGGPIHRRRCPWFTIVALEISGLHTSICLPLPMVFDLDPY